MRTRSGSVFKRRGSWWARVTFRDPESGKRRELTRAARTKHEALDVRDSLLREIERTDGRSIEHEKRTFAEFADYFEQGYLTEPKYVGDRKVAGLRSHQTSRGRLKALRGHFGVRRLRSITYRDLVAFKLSRIDTQTVYGRDRSIATVHRELALLRRMLNIAKRESWILDNPFDQGEPLISPADEKHRERILSAEEERRLLDACVGHRAHLRPILMLMLDTGLRKGEALKLTWADIDFERRSIVIRAFNTKTLRSRETAMTSRVYEVLRFMARDADPSTSVFGIKDNFKRSFEAVRREAGLDGLRLHDLRHTAATRLAQGGLTLAEIGKILGHTQPSTTYRYVNADDALRRRAADTLELISNDVR